LLEKVTSLSNPKIVSQANPEINTQLPKPSAAHLTVAIVLILQSLVLWVILGFAGYAVITGNVGSLLSGVSLVLVVLLGTIWVSNIAYGVIRLRPSAHTPAMVIQLLIASIGAASFGGEFGSLPIGWLALLPAAVAFFLLFSKGLRAEFGKN
jgi:hypothetical protein